MKIPRLCSYLHRRWLFYLQIYSVVCGKYWRMCLCQKIRICANPFFDGRYTDVFDCYNTNLCAISNFFWNQPILNKVVRKVLQCPQQKCHIQWKRQNLPHATNIIVSKLDGAADVYIFRMIQNRFCTLDVAGRRFYFHERTLAFVADYKIYFQAGILSENNRASVPSL